MASFDLHPLVSEWFGTRLGSPTATQQEGWRRISEGSHTLIAAPTGSGKTLAAFTWWLSTLVAEAADGRLDDRTHVIYVSPLKALGNDIQRNLETPLAQIRELASSKGIELPEVRVHVRSGDTPASERRGMIKKPPHILITTPESFYIMLTADSSRAFMSGARAVIVDEIHSIAQDKRGSHLALSLERLDLLTPEPVQRIGLSATQKPIETVGKLLVGNDREVAIVDAGHQRQWDLSVWVPDMPLGPIASSELKDEVYDEIAARSLQHRSTLVFVDTRKLAERVSHKLGERLGEGKVLPHHGSLSKELRLKAEQGLKSGDVPVIVATASLELGIDIGHVDLVCNLGAPRAFATLLQRIGRSGHSLGGTPKGILYPLTRDELVQCAAAVLSAAEGELDSIILPERPLDILAQQITATVAAGEIEERAVWEMVTRSFPYRDLDRKDFEDVLEMLSEGVAGRHGRRSAHIHRDRVNGMLRPRRGARIAAITSGGAIPDVADYDVVEEPAGTFIGRLNEDFAIESNVGDIFLLGNTSWQVIRVEHGRVRVANAHGAPPTVPFWLGESPGRTRELSAAVGELRQQIASALGDPAALEELLVAKARLSPYAAEQLAAYIQEGSEALGCVPTTDRVVAERFFDEAGGMQLVVHAPFGARVNRALGLGLRKRFCQTFDFELQAAATDDGVLLSLGEQHSFPLESIFGYLRTAILEETLVQAVLPSPMFTNRWRWNAMRSLALLRFTGGRKVPPPILRMRAEDLLSAVFPEQVACQEERMGPIIPPDHPLVNETVRNCLNEAMDIQGLAELVGRMERQEIECVAVETSAPSPFSHEILNSNPYTFLDDAPLEERRARAVSLRRIDPEIAKGVGALSPEAIAEVKAQATPDIRDEEELHDLLMTVIVLPAAEIGKWFEHLAELQRQGRATTAHWAGPEGVVAAAVATERTPHVTAVIGEVRFEPAVTPPPGAGAPPERDEVIKQMVHGWMQHLGPVTATHLAATLGIEKSMIDRALLLLEGSGVVLQGHFNPGVGETEWCERRLLARIHRITIAGLRREIAPVKTSDFIRFLARWQHLHPGTQLHGREGLIEAIAQLQAFELPAPAWERDVLSSRVVRYDPEQLEGLCLSGIVTWGRITLDDPEDGVDRRHATTRATPLTFLIRQETPGLIGTPTDPHERVGEVSAAASEVFDLLRQRGPSFMQDISGGLRRFPWDVERALWELVAAGLVNGDGVAGLRRLLKGQRSKSTAQLRGVPGLRSANTYLPVGRWSLWPANEPVSYEAHVEAFAAQLLRRWGVVFRELLARERAAPRWRDLLGVFRRLEAQQQIRGGRFVEGFVGEQYALPEAVETLRMVRKTDGSAEELVVSAADPLNLVGVITPGEKVSPQKRRTVRFVDGVPVAEETRAPAIRSL